MLHLNTDQLDIHARLMVEEARTRGYTARLIDETHPINTVSPVIMVERGDKRFLLSEAVSNLTSHFGRNIAKDKIRTYDLLTTDNLPVPATHIIRRGSDIDDEALTFLSNHKSIVVKPSNTNHGKGVSVGISTESELVEAVNYAVTQSQKADVLLQQTASGDEFRFLVLGNQTIAVANRRPAYVVGDGIKTVDQLIDEKNADPRRGNAHSASMTKIRKNEVVHFLGENILPTVPAINEQVELMKTSNLSRGGESTNYTDIASKKLKEMAVKAAKSCFLEFAGVDIMTNDIGGGDSGSSYIIEVNSFPGIRMHQLPSHGEPINVASLIFDYLENHTD